MTDDEIIAALKSGEEGNYGLHGRNMSIMKLMSGLEEKGLVETWDCSSSQETRRGVRWNGDKP